MTRRPPKENPISRLAAYLIAAALAVVAALAVATSSSAAQKEGRIVDRMTYDQLDRVANKAIRIGHVYSHRWGDASPWVKMLCYEMIDRQFGPYGTARWARYVVNRESDCNPGAINSSSGTTGIAQIHPSYHRWVDYYRVQRDMRYALATFVRLSRGGHSTGPWCLC